MAAKEKGKLKSGECKGESVEKKVVVPCPLDLLRMWSVSVKN